MGSRREGTVDALDESIGQVIEALYRKGMLSNSVVVFTSDNGGMPIGSDSNTGANWPLRGTKGTLWEGGVRVPAIVWSLLLKPGPRIVIPGLAHAADWLPTLYSAGGGSVSDLSPTDGFDLWPALLSAKSNDHVDWPRQELLLDVDQPSGLAAYRDGNFKLVVVSDPASNNSRHPFGDSSHQQHVPIPGNEPPFCSSEEAATVYFNSRMKSSPTWRTLEKLGGPGQGFPVTPGWRGTAAVKCNSESIVSTYVGLNNGDYLFDLSRDPCELQNLASQLPSVVSSIKDKLQVYRTVARQPSPHTIVENGLPEYNDCVWAPWQDQPQSAFQNCSCSS
ncbi:hypothetical protein HPB50_007197 [Hyalomma asiaticum]|uniref:Uncharacterized protein n=1 Tax=Hyalomma asiaticum TaxID=266040 RepID=A0ACB7TG54_HYAAI|nr:hypothetical protein HPB50_007197 [Hyalomma asiaticum]